MTWVEPLINWSRIFDSMYDKHFNVSTLYFKQYKMVYVRLCKEYKYKKDGEEKHSINFVLNTFKAAEKLVKILGDVGNLAKKYKAVRLISNILCF